MNQVMYVQRMEPWIINKIEHRQEQRVPKLMFPTTEIFKYTQLRPLHYNHRRPSSELASYLSKQLPGLLKEKEYDLGAINKIFASTWVSDRQVAFGTKCNKLIVMDLFTSQKAHIPSLKSSERSIPADCPCGIHSISVNPSRTLLATGAENTNDLAVYKLPTFDPVCVGENGHTDWIFDVKWLDDQFVVTGSRDSKLCLWSIKDDDERSRESAATLPDHYRTEPVTMRSCKRAEKVRAMAYNDRTQELGALSLNAQLHFWDVETFTQKSSKKLSHPRENVCMAIWKEKCVYAVGSQSHVALVDPKSSSNKGFQNIQSKHRGCGIRSVDFNEQMLTIGSGAGTIHFYDLRANKYLESGCGHACDLIMGKGWLQHDDTYRDFFNDQEYPNAVYTHCFDESGTRLFAAGGPLPAGLWGNYAGLWQ